jgi:hypothetical protein
MPANILSKICLPVSSKNLKIKIYKTIILPLLCMGVNLVSHTKGRKYTDGIWEQGADDNIRI